tara:strand:+ start:456 stop:737 length:282 start_codon:yes stop_codon:yes gene_type:complete
MALTQSVEDDRIEITGPFRSINVRTSTTVLDGETQIAQSYSRKVLECRENKTGAWEDTDVSGESEFVQSVCNAVWTDEIRDAFKAEQDKGPIS